MHRSKFALLFVSAMFSWMLCQTAVANEFRVETEVFVDKEEEPLIRTLTIFSDGVVYDFLKTGSEEITLFDRQRKRLVLMDTKRKVKAELTTEGILSFIATMQAHLNEPQRQYLLADNLELTTDEEGSVILSNDAVMYRAQGQKPKQSTAAMDYRQFADWYARLNSMRLGNLPPFARLRLNTEMESRGLIPSKIERVIKQKKTFSTVEHKLRSEHAANWRLSNSDRQLIDRAGTCLAMYRTVSFRDYIRLPEETANVDSRR